MTNKFLRLVYLFYKTMFFLVRVLKFINFFLKNNLEFQPLSENQVVQQVMQSKKVDYVNLSEIMAQLCKKLAEKRVFGSRLMSQTTLAAPNHSNYNNLPIEGITYIQRKLNIK